MLQLRLTSSNQLSQHVAAVIGARDRSGGRCNHFSGSQTNQSAPLLATAATTAIATALATAIATAIAIATAATDTQPPHSTNTRHNPRVEHGKRNSETWSLLLFLP